MEFLVAKSLVKIPVVQGENNVRHQPFKSRQCSTLVHNLTQPKNQLARLFQKRTAEVEQLSQALKSGDLAAAEQDYNNIVALGNKIIHRDNPFFRSDRGLDFNAIGGALQNGDLAGARRAFAALENTYKLPPASTASAPSSSLKSGVDVVA